MGDIPRTWPDEVLIVGAGPTGLTLAIALAAHGVGFSIIDRKAGPCPDSKALALNMASQYGFELLGLGGKLGRSGCRLDRINVHWNKKKLFGVNFQRLDFHLTSFIAQPQSDTEQELIDMLEGQGHSVRWNTQLIDLVQSANVVQTTLQDAHKNRSTHQFSYVVGCDGKHSVVRERMPVKFTGYDYPMHFVLGDFILQWDKPQNQACYYVFDDRFFILVPMGGKRWRVVVKHDGAVPERDAIDPREITDIVSAHFGEDFFSSAPIWISRAPFYMRTSDRLRSERLFIAGDAAHLFSPIGGTGMNTGMQDALNLAWKLAYRLRGWADDTLLDTYEAERIGAIQANARATDQQTRLIARMDRSVEKIASLLPRMSNRSALRSVFPRLYAGLGLSYAHAFSHGAGELCRGLGQVLSAAGVSVRNRVLPSLWVLAYVTDLDALLDLEILQNENAEILRTIVFVDDHMVEVAIAQFSALIIVARDEVLIRAVGVSRNGVLLAFPDGTIGFVGALQQLDEMRQAIIARFYPSSVLSPLPLAGEG